MKKIDPHTLFSLFEANDEQVYEENNVTEVLQNPYVLMGMVVRGVDNFFLLDAIYTKNHRKEYLRTKDQIQHKYFSKLFTYLERINSDKFETKFIVGETFDSGQVNKSLHTMLYFFENLEEYEKCAIIKKYIDLLYEKPNVRLHI